MFASKRLQAAQDQVTSLTSQIGTLTQERDTLLSQQEGLVTAEAHTAVVQERDNLQARVAELEANASTGGQQAADILANLGVPPVAAEGMGSTSEAKTSSDLRAEFDAITDPQARADFWAKNKSQILR